LSLTICNPARRHSASVLSTESVTG